MESKEVALEHFRSASRSDMGCEGAEYSYRPYYDRTTIEMGSIERCFTEDFNNELPWTRFGVRVFIRVCLLLMWAP